LEVFDLVDEGWVKLERMHRRMHPHEEEYGVEIGVVKGSR
jgi:hypothetical protein